MKPLSTNHPEKRVIGGTIVGLVEEVKVPVEVEKSTSPEPEQPKPKKSTKKKAQ